MSKEESKESGERLPAHLAPLLEPTPSGAAKLLAAWDGLSTESQIIVLTQLHGAQIPTYLARRIYAKALESQNCYIRYLGARGLGPGLDRGGDETKGLKERVEQDPDPLVRFCLLEYYSELESALAPVFDKDLEDPEAFFKLPHEARLAKMRSLKFWGGRVAALIGYALDHGLKDGTITETEIFEILCDYVSNPEFKGHYDPEDTSDGLLDGGYARGTDMEALWNLVPRLPETVSYLLIQTLPPAVGIMSEIPETAVKGLTERQLTRLFDRRDIELSELRKEIFFQRAQGEEQREEESPVSRRWLLRWAAVSYNFNLSYEEFAEILARSEREKLEDLMILAHCPGLSPCLYDAIHDVLAKANQLENADSAAHSLERSLRFSTAVGEDELRLVLGETRDPKLARRPHPLLDMFPGSRKRELVELRLYRLARKVVPWARDRTYPPSGELEFLAQHFVPGDTWATFRAFSEQWRQNAGRTKYLESLLPPGSELDERLPAVSEVEEHPASEWKRPLSKADFFAFSLDRRGSFYLLAVFLLFATSVGLAAYGVYTLATDGSGITKLIGAFMLFGAALQATHEYRQINEEYRQIRRITQKTETTPIPGPS